MRVATAAACREADNYAINELGVPSLVLMERAAWALVEQVKLAAENIEEKQIVVFSGSGNNGGDGIAAAAILLESGIETRVFMVGQRNKMTTDALEMEQRLIKAGGKIEDFNQTEDIIAYCNKCCVIIDAIFGIGLRSAPEGKISDAIKLINRISAPVLSADIASGILADSGYVPGEVVHADVTVSFTAAKVGHLVEPGCEYTGRLIVKDIGVSLLQCENVYAVEEGNIRLPKRPQISHKGTFGGVMIIGGSVGYTGAPVIAAKSAQRGGTGLVFVAVPENIYGIVAVKLDEPMPFPLSCDEKGYVFPKVVEEIKARLNKTNVMLIGPGLGRSEMAEKLVLELFKNTDMPIVLDADGINAFERNINMLDGQGKTLVLTPHDGEFRRLGGDVSKDRLLSARMVAQKHKCVLVLKGHRTICAFPDGEVSINTTGNSGMAKGGSGDALAGLIASFIAQGLDVKTAVPAAVYICGAAADVLSQRLTEYALLPSDIINAIPEIMKKIVV